MQLSSAPKPLETDELEKKVELDCAMCPSSLTVGDDEAIKSEKKLRKLAGIGAGTLP
jgi:hypothetical protein